MRRERYTILADILAAIEHASRSAPPRVTMLVQRANLPHDRLKDYLHELEAAGLVQAAPAPALTPEGREFMRKYREWQEVLERFGLDPPGAHEPPKSL